MKDKLEFVEMSVGVIMTFDFAVLAQHNKEFKIQKVIPKSISYKAVIDIINDHWELVCEDDINDAE